MKAVTLNRALVRAAILFLVVMMGWLAYRQVLAAVAVAFAEEQVSIFVAMRDKAASSSPVEAVGYLVYAANYYPSGTKQAAGSRLDRLVESVRQDVCAQIMAGLKARTEQQIDTVAGWLDWAESQERGEPVRSGSGKPAKEAVPPKE